MRKIVNIFWLTIVFVSIIFFYNELNDDFSLKNISIVGKENVAWQITTPSEVDLQNLENILAQPFTYLGKGHQTYAFVSQDQQYVLKFIKYTYLKSPFYLAWLPNFGLVQSYRQNLLQHQAMRINRIFQGYHLAYTKNKDNTGMLYVHLLKTDNLHKPITLTSRYGFNYNVNLDEVSFMLQRKAQTTKNTLTTLLQNNEVEKAKKQIRKILNLYTSEYLLSLHDDDHNIIHNTGFVDDIAIRIDVGRLMIKSHKDPLTFKTELERLANKRLSKWLSAHYPQYHSVLFEDMHTAINDIYQLLLAFNTNEAKTAKLVTTSP